MLAKCCEDLLMIAFYVVASLIHPSLLVLFFATVASAAFSQIIFSTTNSGAIESLDGCGAVWENFCASSVCVTALCGRMNSKADRAFSWAKGSHGGRKL